MRQVTGGPGSYTAGGIRVYFDMTDFHVFAKQISADEKTAIKKIKQAVRVAGKQVESRARILAPVDYGDLRRSIHAQFKMDDARGRYEAIIEPSVDYGRFPEWGTSRQRPQPYMRPALAEVEPSFQKAVELAWSGWG